MNRPWLRFYDPEVPSSLEYPRIPLYRLLDDSARQRPGRPCVNFYGRRISYGTIKELSDRAAAGFRHLGVHKGDRVALLLPNSPRWMVVYRRYRLYG